jgi:PAT family acetyl-CoA transporter-like MFS transporter 1
MASTIRNRAPGGDDHAPLDFAPDDDDNAKGAKGLGGLKGDYGSIALLLLLYTLQGVPMGRAVRSSPHRLKG